MGSIDEAERVFSREEKRIAEVLKDEGKEVKAKADPIEEAEAEAIMVAEMPTTKRRGMQPGR